LSGIQTQAGGRVWVTGAGGLIGQYIIRAAEEKAPLCEVIALARPDLELTDFARVERRFLADRPRLVIHCAAMSKSPDCQSNPGRAKLVNVEATARLAALAGEIGFIFFSTDLVFDGKKGNYIETDAVNPLSVYGETKAAAEEIVLKNLRHVIVRTSLNSGASPKGNVAYNEQLRDGWKRGRTLQFFFDEYRCPIAACVTARAIWELAASGRGGTYHLAGSERLSRAQIGELAAARHPELETRMEICSLREYPGAPRAADTSLNCAKIQPLLSFPLPGLTQWLREHPEDVF
jgi:dTDP-4-dehydrorhamnose reductase